MKEGDKMKYRHEIKHEITFEDMLILRQRLSSVMKRDVHTSDGKYEIISLYFDNDYDKALLEKINGMNYREKFRIRYYNDDTSFIKLEKKSKISGKCLKESIVLTDKQTQQIIYGNIDWMVNSNIPLIVELYSKMKSQGLKPKTIVKYTREPFVYPAGNVRITLDYNIRTGILSKDFLNPDCVTVPAGDSHIILEVKWDEFLPDIIRDAVMLDNRREGAFSKYATCRIYG